MLDSEILILKGHEISSLLAEREGDLINLVKAAYQSHAGAESSLPHSTFLRFPNGERDRIIALPAYLGGEFNVAGVKWISSFPGNLALGLDRASAVLVLNSMLTGRPQAILEGSIISAKRTAASAALAAHCLLDSKMVDCLGIIGCGVINFEIACMFLATLPSLRRLLIFDTDPAGAQRFRTKFMGLSKEIEVVIAPNMSRVLTGSSLVSMATTAIQPHIYDVSGCSPGAVILHVSLRDLSPEVILSCDNIVDDVDHVCRAQTSLHLAEQLVGHRGFIKCSLADILNGAVSLRGNPSGVTIFSPFGLGILDIAVGKYVCDLAIKAGQGLTIGSFIPDSWHQEPSGGA